MSSDLEDRIIRIIEKRGGRLDNITPYNSAQLVYELHAIFNKPIPLSETEPEVFIDEMANISAETFKELYEHTKVHNNTLWLSSPKIYPKIPQKYGDSSFWGRPSDSVVNPFSGAAYLDTGLKPGLTTKSLEECRDNLVTQMHQSIADMHNTILFNKNTLTAAKITKDDLEVGDVVKLIGMELEYTISVIDEYSNYIRVSWEDSAGISMNHWISTNEISHILTEGTIAERAANSRRECECGAKHTSNPKFHLKFCPLA